MKQKPVVSSKLMNNVIKAMPKYENKKNKLNAGGKREGAKSVFNAIVNDLSKREKLAIINAILLSL